MGVHEIFFGKTHKKINQDGAVGISSQLNTKSQASYYYRSEIFKSLVTEWNIVPSSWNFK